MRVTRAILFLLLLCVGTEVSAEPDSVTRKGREYVIILHGLGRTKNSMKRIESSLSKEDYETWNQGYPSTEENIEALVDAHLSKAVQYCRKRKASKIHFVTHSLGGILVRKYLSEHDMPNLGRVVMLSPPNKGSEVADALKDYKVYQWITGPAGQEIGTDPQSLPNTLPPVHGEVGIIAGSRTSDPWFSPMIPGKDDGKVSIERTKLAEMTDFLVVRRGHTFIMNDPEVIRQVIFFLKNARFDHGPVDQ